jgi:hypothetical protein
MAVGVPHKYMQINTYERSKCYVQLIISQTSDGSTVASQAK